LVKLIASEKVQSNFPLQRLWLQTCWSGLCHVTEQQKIRLSELRSGQTQHCFILLFWILSSVWQSLSG